MTFLLWNDKLADFRSSPYQPDPEELALSFRSVVVADIDLMAWLGHVYLLLCCVSIACSDRGNHNGPFDFVSFVLSEIILLPNRASGCGCDPPAPVNSTCPTEPECCELTLERRLSETITERKNGSVPRGSSGRCTSRRKRVSRI